jgi:hypothetical protein
MAAASGATGNAAGDGAAGEGGKAGGMSGGSYNYAYRHIADMADELRTTTQLRKAFKTHLRKVAVACQQIEWVDSGDNAPGDEDEPIRACLGKNSDALVMAEVLAEARHAFGELADAIKAAERKEATQ